MKNQFEIAFALFHGKSRICDVQLAMKITFSDHVTQLPDRMVKVRKNGFE